MDTKNEIRLQIRQIRDNLSPLERAKKSTALCELFLESALYQKTSCICLYFATQSEVELNSLFTTALKDRKKVFFPKTRGKEMDFMNVSEPTDFLRGAFGVYEPRDGKIMRITENATDTNLIKYVNYARNINDAKEISGVNKNGIGTAKDVGNDVIANKIDDLDHTGDLDYMDVTEVTMLVPGIAFDRKGGRIGYGKGFYDRYLQGKKHITTVGVAFACQICNKPMRLDETDKKMDYLLTEDGLLSCKEE